MHLLEEKDPQAKLDQMQEAKTAAVTQVKTQKLFLKMMDQAVVVERVIFDTNQIFIM